MITDPINDRECLAKVTDVARQGVERPDVRTLSERFGDTDQLVHWIRTLPQRDDDGNRADGPRIDCGGVTQRVRLRPGDPNCVERSILYLSTAEHLDPGAERQLATIDTPAGLHTFPVENGEPVKLDPLVTRNAMCAGLDAMRNARLPRNNADLLQWVVDIATEPAEASGRVASVRNAASAMNDALAGAPLRNLDDLGITFALAEQAARLWGGQGIDAVRLAMLGLQRLAARNARNVSFRLDTKALGRIGRVAGTVGARVGQIALRAKLASMGIPPSVVDELEREFNAEGLTLGPFAKKPPEQAALETLLLKGLS